MAVSYIKHSRHKGALSVVKTSKARLMSEVEARKKEKPQKLATKKMQAVMEKTVGGKHVTATQAFKIEHKSAARHDFNKVQQEYTTKEIKENVILEFKK